SSPLTLTTSTCPCLPLYCPSLPLGAGGVLENNSTGKTLDSKTTAVISVRSSHETRTGVCVRFVIIGKTAAPPPARATHPHADSRRLMDPCIESFLPSNR